MIRLDVLPAAQRTLWDEDLPALPAGFVLYGGTAIALHLGHRTSVDFDFFSSHSLDRVALRRACPMLATARTLQEAPDTLTVVVEKDGEPVKLSFFGGIGFGRVGEPIRVPDRPPIASRIDLLATKLATITQRVEARDYLDVAALLDSGLSIDAGVAALLALYGNQASGLQSVKTIAWFEDGDLERLLPRAVRDRLAHAAASYDPRTGPATLRACRLD